MNLFKFFKKPPKEEPKLDLSKEPKFIIYNIDNVMKLLLTRGHHIVFNTSKNYYEVYEKSKRLPSSLEFKNEC